eukprot:scaffold146193_cov23-Tisochrysis_lutea.AAC.1
MQPSRRYTDPGLFLGLGTSPHVSQVATAINAAARSQVRQNSYLLFRIQNHPGPQVLLPSDAPQTLLFAH